MKINDKIILKISIITFLVGLSLLYLITVYTQYNEKQDITKKIEEKQETSFVKLNGIIKKITTYNTTLYLTLYNLNDNNYYSVVIYKKRDETIDLNKEDEVEVYGYLNFNKKTNKTFVVASKIIK